MNKKQQARQALDDLKRQVACIAQKPNKAKAAIKAMRKEMKITEEKLRRRVTI